MVLQAPFGTTAPPSLGCRASNSAKSLRAARRNRADTSHFDLSL